MIAIMLIPKGPSFISLSYHCEVNCCVTKMKSGLKGYHLWRVLLLLHPGALRMKSTHKGGGLPWCFTTPPSTTGGSAGKESTCVSGDPDPIPGWGRSPGEGNSSPLQYSYLENSMHGGSWLVTVHGITESRTRRSNFPGSLVPLQSKQVYSLVGELRSHMPHGQKRKT